MKSFQTDGIVIAGEEDEDETIPSVISISKKREILHDTKGLVIPGEDEEDSSIPILEKLSSSISQSKPSITLPVTSLQKKCIRSSKVLLNCFHESIPSLSVANNKLIKVSRNFDSTLETISDISFNIRLGTNNIVHLSREIKKTDSLLKVDKYK